MLESLTILSKGGLVLFQYVASPSLVGADDPIANTRQSLNAIIPFILNNPTKDVHIIGGLTFCWLQENDSMAVAMYPDILFEGPRQYLKVWAQQLLKETLREYKLYASKVEYTVRPDPGPFDRVFRVLLERSKTQKQDQPQTTKITSDTEPSKKSKAGKEKRQWHDGNAKVTDKAMAELDMSADAGTTDDAHERALNEARQAFLPDEADLEDEKEPEMQDTTSSWSSSVTGLLQQLAGNKVLTASDLEKPLEQMEELLIEKNVAREIAANMCATVKSILVGKKLNSLYRVQTAVRQALEKAIGKLLQNDIDLLRLVLTKRGDSSLFKHRSRAPFAITVMGINGIGKTTSLAKLAYYFQTNGCKPLLVAGDTFRSGAVEQLRVHADCLELPLFSQGYSKDPSAVAKAAIQQATEQGNDVVLIDTAGRMQNNVPLMKALGKLVEENKPDCVLLVCEALVGHDGLSQFRMFRQALGSRDIDGLILTKYDTVSSCSLVYE